MKNEFLVDKTDGLCLLYDEETEGSPKYYLEAAKKKAHSQDYPIVTISRFDIELAADELQQQDPNYWSENE